MLELILVIIGVLGFGAAGYLDLKYTEFPGKIPYGMIAAIFLVLVADGFVTNSFGLLASSVLNGLLFLAIGLAFYFLKQWGDGDAWLLGALGFSLPTQLLGSPATSMPFYASILLNFLVVSIVYVVVYCIVLGFGNSKVKKLFTREIRNNYKIKLASIIILFAFCFSIGFYFYTVFLSGQFILYIFILPFIFTFLIFFMDYAKVVEKQIFRKKVLTKKLKPGDVILDGRWRGATRSDIKKIKTKYVWVKEGVRFAPVFLITFLITVFFGNLFWFI